MRKATVTGDGSRKLKKRGGGGNSGKRGPENGI